MAPEQAAVTSEPLAWHWRSQAASTSNMPGSAFSGTSSDSGTQTTAGATQSDNAFSTRIGNWLQPVTSPACAPTITGSSSDWP